MKSQITILLCVSYFFVAAANDKPIRTTIYATSIEAAMLPKKAVQQKIEMLKEISQETESLIPHLARIKALYASGQLKEIAELLEKKPELKKIILEHPNTGLIVVKTFARLAQEKDAIELMIALNDKHPTEPEIALLAAQFYERKGELKNALKIIDTYLNKSPQRTSHFAFLLLKKQIHLKLGDKQKALESIEQALQLQPRFDAGWLMFAQLLESKGQLESAMKGYGNYLELAAPKPKNVASAVLFKAIEAKLLDLIFNQVIKKQPSFSKRNKNGLRNKIMQLFREQKYKSALEEIEKLLSKQSNDTDRLLKIQILCAMKKFETAADQLKKWIMQEPEAELWFQALHLLYYSGLDSRYLIGIFQEIEKQFPKNLNVHLYLADMLTRTAQFKEAIAHHHKSLTLTNDPALQTSIFFQLGFLYYETKQFKNMKLALERGRALGFEYAPLLNLLAYYYVSKENKPDKAQQLMTIVLKQCPDNPHFLDTQALIYYKQEKYVKALALLEKISQQEPDDATIMKHLAKTYRKLGMLDRSIACMEQTATLTYDKKKKKKYQRIAKLWKKQGHGQKHNLLCSR